MPWLRKLARWFDSRLGLAELVMPVLRHPIPASAAGPLGWWYVFGSASLTLLAIQFLTGVLLALVYVPDAGQAYESLQYLTHQQPWGGFFRAVHFWAASGMVLMVVVHMTQVFLHGAFKYPRELTWVVGVLLLVLTLGMAFTGQVLRWDADAYWGVGVGASMAGRVPVAGPSLVRLLTGGDIVGGATLSRFFTLHVFVLPGLLVALLGVHLWLVLKQGISEAPVPGEGVDPATYHQRYERQLRQGVPFLGDAMLKDACFSALVVLAVVAIAAWAGPQGPGDPPSPTFQGANPRPDWPFLWLFALLSLSPPEAETAIILLLPPVLVGALLMVPLVGGRGERAPSRRPVSVLAVVVLYTLFGVLTWVGHASPWSPVMDAWSGDPVPVAWVERATPLELQGMVVFQNKSCRNCHALEGVGGRRGPDLSRVGTRLTRSQLIEQVINGTPGGGNMPAYGKHVSPAEMEALAEFLTSLRPEGQPPPQVTFGPSS